MQNILCAQLLALDCLIFTPFRINSQLLGHWCPVDEASFNRTFTYLHQSNHWSQTNAAFFHPSTIVKYVVLCTLIQIQVSFISDILLFKNTLIATEKVFISLRWIRVVFSSIVSRLKYIFHILFSQTRQCFGKYIQHSQMKSSCPLPDLLIRLKYMFCLDFCYVRCVLQTRPLLLTRSSGILPYELVICSSVQSVHKGYNMFVLSYSTQHHFFQQELLIPKYSELSDEFVMS